MASSAPRHSQSPPARVRASDSDRERVVDFLRHHYGAGRLSEDDLSERIESAYGARPVAQLATLIPDLPPKREPPASRRRRSGLETSVRVHLTTFLLVNLMLIGIW